MAGITREGITIKRQREVIEDLKERAVPIFQDLVPPNDVVDTSDDSTIGRIIGLNSLALADLWELAQEVYWAFDPNSATGVALDNLVQYAGLIREPATPSTVTLVVWGDEGTTILSTQNTVRASDNTLYDIMRTIQLQREANIGVRVDVPQVVQGEDYVLTISSGSNSFSVSYTAQPGDNEEKILSEIQSSLSSYVFLRTSYSDNMLTVETVDVFDQIGVGVNNLEIRKVKGRTEGINQEVGPKEQARNTVNQIATPLLGWDSVNNPFDAVVGRGRETDEELRERFRVSKFLRAQNISDALYSSLREIDGVRHVAVYENESDIYDPVYNLPPHSFRAVIQGGNPIEVARAIWLNKPLGIAPHGNTSEIIKDSQGFDREMKWDRPIDIPIYITMTLTTNGTFPATGVQDIKAQLIDYFREEQSIGEDVVFSRLYTPINKVAGHQVDSLFIGTSPNPTGSSNIPIAYNEMATINSDDIVININ